MILPPRQAAVKSAVVSGVMSGVVDFGYMSARTILPMPAMSPWLWTVVLTCLALLGCGTRPSPAAPVAGRDSTAPATGQTLPVPVSGTGVQTASTAAPAGESVPAIISRAFPAARSVRIVSKPFPHRVIRDSAGAILGYEACSDSAGVTARGYAGMVPLRVFFDARARPVRIYVLDNCETPAYMDLVLHVGLLDSLLAYDPAKPESVDAVTLATSSSHAIISGVTGLAARVLAELVAKSRGSRGSR